MVWITSRNGGNNGPTTTVPDTTVAGEVSPPGTDTLRPVPTVSYAFVASFDSKQATASLSGVASPTGAARLKNALASVGRLALPKNADKRLQALMDANNEGRLSAAERRELAALVEWSENVSLLRAQALRLLGRQAA